jgi:ankyrin repeat protein
MFSERALELAELIEAVAITPKTRNLKQLRSNAIRRPNDVFQLCGSLIRQSQATGKISLSHYFVKEFLSLPFIGKGRPDPFHLQEVASQKSQFEKCILYLALEDIASGSFHETLRLALDPLHGDSDLQSIASFTFLDYASSFWAAHLKHLSMDEFVTIWPLLKRFFDTKEGGFDCWILISQYSHGAYKFPLGAKAVHVAALYGLDVMLAGLLQGDPSSLTKKTLDGRTPLHIALENEQEQLVDLLLEPAGKHRSANETVLMMSDKRGRTPPHIAIESGNEHAVKKLLKAGAKPNTNQPDGRTPIYFAIEINWDQLADTLVPTADPSRMLVDGRSLLHVAAESGSLVWVTALLKSHEDWLIDAKDANGWTPLHYAVDGEHPEIVTKLLDSDCQIGIYDNNGWSPLHAAIRRRNLECASLLLNRQWPGGRLRRPGPASPAPETRAESSRPIPETLPPT